MMVTMTDEIDPKNLPRVLRPKLAGIREIANLFHVPRTTASMWYQRRATTGFPEAIQELAMGPVFDLDAVIDWHEEWSKR